MLLFEDSVLDCLMDVDRESIYRLDILWEIVLYILYVY